MAGIAGYKGVVKIGTDILPVKGDVVVTKAKASIDETALGDTSLPYRTYILGLVDEQRFSLPVRYEAANAAIAACRTAWTNETTVTMTIESESGTTLWVADYLVTQCGWRTTMDGYQEYTIEFLLNGAPTTDNL